ncbi:MAG TPA: IS110 family transposase, partial [Thermoanaerobaculia bacterium]|nr:IS110 family transposase [Thermoanaerobaculia bacterium]
STSVYWLPVYERLEDVAKVLVANASHVKKVPGRKTDAIDAEWLAELGAHGLLRPSFIPPKEIRVLRAYSRYRTKLRANQSGVRNRTIKFLEMSGIKLSSVVSDCFGVTGRAILDNLAAGKTVDVAAVARMALRKKLPELARCLGPEGLSPHQQQLLRMQLTAYDALDAQIAEVELTLEKLSAPYAALLERLDAIPGINRISATTLIAEIGTDPTVYRNAKHLCALAGVAPGNAISAETRRRIGVRRGNRYLKRILVQIAWAATNAKESFLRARFYRLQRRIGRNKAVVAVARQILVLVYTVLGGATYNDRGALFYAKRNPTQTVRRYVRQIEALGFTVTLIDSSK